MAIAMNRTRWIGVALWAGCLICTVVAVGFGLAAAQEMIDRAVGIGFAIGFGLAAEALFWSGGAVLGLSFFARNNSWLGRLVAMVTARKPPA